MIDEATGNRGSEEDGSTCGGCRGPQPQSPSGNGGGGGGGGSSSGGGGGGAAAWEGTAPLPPSPVPRACAALAALCASNNPRGFVTT